MRKSRILWKNIYTLLTEQKINPNSPRSTGKLAKILDWLRVYVSRDTLDARMKDIKKAGKSPALG